FFGSPAAKAAAGLLLAASFQQPGCCFGPPGWPSAAGLRALAAGLLLWQPGCWSVQRPACGFDRRQERSGTDQSLDGFQIAVQRSVTAQRADMFANMQICRLRPTARSQPVAELQPLGGA